MGLTHNLKNAAGGLQDLAKSATISFSQRLLRFMSGFFVGLVVSLIIQVFAQSGTLMLIFFTVVFTAVIYRLLRSFSIFQIFIFDVICILVATLLRMYIMIAP